MDEHVLFNPLDKRNLGKSVVEALLSKDAISLSSIGPFKGAGIYAIYYNGDFEYYSELSALNKDGFHFPIYVGKAIPKGGRKGSSLDASMNSNALANRLLKHKSSIESTISLNIEDFSYRVLPVDDIWIPLGESLVIQKYAPLWNQVVEGFGNHDPGSGRYSGKRPLWDELHPGRVWAAKCKNPKLSRNEIVSLVREYMTHTIQSLLSDKVD